MINRLINPTHYSGDIRLPYDFAPILGRGVNGHVWKGSEQDLDFEKTLILIQPEIMLVLKITVPEVKPSGTVTNQ